jgi:hypothetical protein
MKPGSSLPCLQEPNRGQVQHCFFYDELLFTAQHQAGGLPLVGCPPVFIKKNIYICSYFIYLEAIFSIRNLRTRSPNFSIILLSHSPTAINTAWLM